MKNVLLIASALMLGSFNLSAQTQLPNVAVVSLDLPVNRNAEQTVLKTLSNADVNTISSQDLAERLESAKSPIPTKEIAGEFAKMSVQISEGVEKFFYDSEKKSIAKLQPVFELGMNNISVLARRADYADQIFQAGILLIRAYEVRKQKEKAEAIVQAIVEHFPTQTFTASVIPPKVIKRLEDARQNLVRSKTTLTLVNNEIADQCVAYLNGFVAPLNEAIFVKIDTDYHVRLDCGLQNPTVWQTRLEKPNTTLSVPLTAGDPFNIGISSNDSNARQKAETALKAIMFWANLDQIVGVSENLKITPKVQVVRIQSGEKPKWSQSSDKRGMDNALMSVFPELDLVSPKRSTDWLGWTFIGTGLATAGGGAVLWATTLDKQKELECGYGNRSDCDGIEIRDPDSSDFKADQDAIDTRILGSYVLYGIGGALVGYGLFRVITHQPKEEISFSPTFSPNSTGLQVHAHF